MAINIDWKNKIINIPKADTTLVGTDPVTGREIRELDVDVFRLALKALEAEVSIEGGMTELDTHSHNTTVTVGGVALARVVEIINGFKVTFEDGQYAVNLVGANNNISEVSTVNQVSIRPSNSAGLIVVTQGSGVIPQDILDIASAVWDEILTGHTTPDSAGAVFTLIKKILGNDQEIDKVLKELIIFDDDGSTPILRFNLEDGNGNASAANIFKRIKKSL